MIGASLLVAALAAPPALVERSGSERITDAFGVIGTTLATTLGGILVGLRIDESPDCFDCDFASSLLGGMVGLAMGPALFDGLSDGDGSLAGAYAGFLLGTLVAVGTEGQLWFLIPLGLGVGYASFDSVTARPTVVDTGPNVLLIPERDGHRVPAFGFSGRF